ncbi:MAG TPA: alpha/beta hydrolase [Limnobacter sp.]|uniref:alpha/beta fold hydrolase n=1 Tax=Limnobacter sp. TaxID=2003368 RepID=UPI002EDAC84E
MKKWLVGALVVAGLASWGLNANPVTGQLFMQYGGQLEARVHGFTEKTVTAAGIAHRLYEGGDTNKPTVVLLHGYSADKDVWPRFAAHLVKDYHVVIPDMAGHGETGFQADWDYTIPAQAARVVALMDAMDVKQFHVVGNSMGGYISATLAANFPDRVLSVSALDPAGVQSPKPSKMAQMVAAGRNPFEVQSAEQFKEFYAMTMAKPPYLPQFVLNGMAKTYMDRRDQLATIFKAIHQMDVLGKRLGDIKAPMLLLWGAKDDLIDVSSVPVWQAGVKNLRVKIYDDLGHMPMVEAPEESARDVKAFIDSVQTTPAH